jgi:hypothetical protein
MILTKNPITKGSPALFTLNKTDLALNSLVTSSVHFSNQANWSLVMVNYKSTIHDQPKNLIFDASLSSPTAYFQTSTSADDVFEVQKVIIQDKDGGLLVIPRSLLTTAEAEFDVNMGAVLQVWDTLTGTAISSGSGQLERTDFTLGWDAGAWHDTPITGDFTFSGIYSVSNAGGGDTMVGYRTALPIGGSAIDNYISTSIYFHGIASVGTIYGGSPIIDNNSILLNVTPATNTFEIKRVGTLITAKVNGTLSFHETEAGSIYIASVLQGDPANAYSIVSSTLTLD